jgi:hypothetical protein
MIEAAPVQSMKVTPAQGLQAQKQSTMFASAM